MLRRGAGRTFRTDALPGKPAGSGIGLVYDPGRPIVLHNMDLITAEPAPALPRRPSAQRDPPPTPPSAGSAPRRAASLVRDAAWPRPGPAGASPTGAEGAR